MASFLCLDLDDSLCKFYRLIMGFIDIFKRWQLARKGMSSGKKRRTVAKGESAVVESMENTLWMKFLIYPIFAALICFIVSFSDAAGVLFHDDLARRTGASLIISAVLILYYHIRESIRVKNGEVVLVFGSILINLLLIWTCFQLVNENILWSHDFMIVVAPLAFAPMVLSILCGRHAGVFAALSTSLLGSLMVSEADLFSFVIISLAVGCVAVSLTRRVRRRGSLLRAGFYVGISTLLLSLAFGKIDLTSVVSADSIYKEGGKILLALLSGLLTGMVVSGLLPALEGMFSITTSISWLEMSDLNHKLLRKLQLEAPGTYHHSMVVATLAESAAEEIGADASMCRVCSYFHDIGKLSKPEYFIENQGEINPHDSISPTMSAIVIIAHVKDGVDMAIKHKLNSQIIDVIREHHGSSIVQYFYHKAREQRLEAEKRVDDGLESRDELTKVDVKSFKYPGPCPSSRESGIISLADSVESASRSLKKPTPQKIRNLVSEIVMARVTSGQLDDSQLTMGEIKTLIDSFASTLRSMMHTRIDYPKDDTSASASERKDKIEEDDVEEKETPGNLSPELKKSKAMAKKSTESAKAKVSAK
ncbi:MAG: HD family phosphohydrolase [Akkermansiaceae bacterium]